MANEPGSEAEGLRDLLAQAAALGKVERVRDLLGRGAPARGHGAAGGSTPWSGYTSLMVACYCGQLPAARILLEAGADPRERGASGDTPLGVSCARGRADCVDALLAAGADFEGADRQGRSALRMACEAAREDIVATLLAAGADPGSRDDLGNSPSMAAVASGSRACLALLAAAGADFDTAGWSDGPLLDFARSGAHWADVAGWLEAADLARRERLALEAERLRAAESGEGAGSGSGRL